MHGPIKSHSGTFFWVARSGKVAQTKPESTLF